MFSFVESVLLFIIYVVGFLACIPSLWLLSHMRGQETHVAIVKRRPYLMVVLFMQMIVICLLERPLMATFLWNSDTPSWAIVCLTALSYVSLVAFGHTVCVRFWIIFYDMKLAQVDTDKKWRIYIDPTTEKQTRLWYLNNRSTLGNARFLLSIILIGGFFFVGVPTFYLTTIQKHLGITVMIGEGTIPVLLTAVWWSKYVPNFQDRLGIRNEMNAASCVAFVFAIITIPLLVLENFFSILRFVRHVSVICLIATVMFTFAWCAIRQLDGLPTLSSQHDDNGSRSQRQKLQYLLEDEVLLIDFIDHLSEEFSLENILFVIETMQFKSFLVEQDSELKDLIRKALPIIKFPPSIPQSEIVFSAKYSGKSFPNAWKAKELFTKYIESSSPLEVNLSYQTRSDLEELFVGSCEDFEVGNALLFTSFDDALKEILILMCDSRARFVSRPSHLKVLQLASVSESG